MTAKAGKTLEESGVIRVKTDELKNHIGDYLILWRNKRKTLVLLEEVNENEKKIVYKVESGPDKGERIRSKYDTSQTVYVCTKEQQMLGLLFTQS